MSGPPAPGVIADSLLRAPVIPCDPPLEHARALLEAATGLTGTSLALVSPEGETLIAAGEAVRRERQDECEFVSVPVAGPVGEIGTLVATLPPEEEKRGPRSSPAEMARCLQGLASLLSTLAREQVDLRLMSQELATHYEQFNLIFGVSRRLAEGGNLRKVLRYILEESQATTGSEWALLHLDDRRILEVYDWVEERGELTPAQRRLLPGLAATIRRELLANSLQPVVGAGEVERQLESLLGSPARLLAVPILVKDELQGCLAVAHLSPEASFTTNDAKLMETLAEQVSLAVTNSELHENLRAFLMNTVRSLVSAIDAKDSYTRGHSERVQRISLLLGEAMGLPPEELDALGWASILHDVGKLGVPEAILHKPGALSEEELSVMRRHPTRSCEILAPIPELVQSIPGIRHHHERQDGSGYPDGLRGETIPLVARIVAVADVFDALTSDRAYRPALNPDEVRRYLRGSAGKQLDSKVVEAFDAMFPELVATIQTPPGKSAPPGEREEETGECDPSASGQRDTPRAVATAD